MTRVFCFSGSGHSRAVADWVAEALSCQRIDMERAEALDLQSEAPAVVVFPVYCQAVPPPVRRFLRGLRSERVTLIATYGGFSHGNALWEAQRLLKGDRVVAGVYVPTGHTYLEEPAKWDAEALSPLLARVREGQMIRIPKARKHPLAGFFPAWRSRLGVRIHRSDACNGCGRCARNCPMGAVKNGKPDRRCIRCLRCVTECPQRALRFSSTLPMRLYLKKKRTSDSVKIYSQT